MIIGKFTPHEDGYVGEIVTALGFISPVRIAPAKSEAVDFTVSVSGLELGAAWKRHSAKTGKAYLSVKLDSPFAAAPVNGALIEQTPANSPWSGAARSPRPKHRRRSNPVNPAGSPAGFLMPAMRPEPSLCN